MTRITAAVAAKMDKAVATTVLLNIFAVFYPCVFQTRTPIDARPWRERTLHLDAYSIYGRSKDQSREKEQKVVRGEVNEKEDEVSFLWRIGLPGLGTCRDQHTFQNNLCKDEASVHSGYQGSVGGMYRLCQSGETYFGCQV